MDSAVDNVMTGTAGSFPSTQWSMVLEAGRDGSSGGQQALEGLCGKYWYPIYAYIRRRGNRPENAQDLTQEFFARFLERRYFALADPGRGRYRTFLLTSVRHFLNDEWDRTRAAKRGGASVTFSWDAQGAEDRYRCEPADRLTPEKVFDQRWASAVLGEVLGRLRQEHIAAEKGEQFDVLKGFLLSGDGAARQWEVAAKMRMTEGAVRAAVCRMRARYRQLLLDEIAQTVSSEADARDEVRELFAAFG